MGRPPRHDSDRLLDSAVTLAADAGPQAVTMSAVARTSGAPSGSVYHRFPDRPTLLAALWLRTVLRFQQGFLAALEEDPPLRGAVAAARHVVEWSKAHPYEARVLLYGPRDFVDAEWPAQARESAKKAAGELEAGLRTLVHRLDATGREGADRVLLAVVDLPYAMVRRHLLAGTPIPSHAGDLIAEGVAALLRTQG